MKKKEVGASGGMRCWMADFTWEYKARLLRDR